MSKGAKILAIALFSIFVMLMVNLWFMTRYRLKIIDIEPIEYSATIPMPISISDAVDVVNSHFKIDYRLKWVKTDKYYGKPDIIFKVVRLSTKNDWWGTIYSLAHELCHIKYYSANEAFVEYMTFVELYESDNFYLHARAEGMIVEHCELRLSAGTKYDIGYYILNYLEGKNYD